MSHQARLHDVLDTYLRGGLQPRHAEDLDTVLKALQGWAPDAVPPDMLANAVQIHEAGVALLQLVLEARRLHNDVDRRGIFSALGDDE